MVRPTEQEMIVIERIVCYSQFPRSRSVPCPEATGKLRGWQEAEGGRERRQEPLLQFPQEGTSKVR